MPLPDTQPWILALLLLLVCPAVVCGERDTAPPAKTRAETPISVEFDDASLSSVVKTFSKILDKNIVIVDGAERTVTVHLHEVSALIALRSILRSKGLLLREDAGIYYVLDQQKAASFP